MIEYLSVLHFQVLEVAIVVVDVDETRRLGGHQHGAEEHINQGGVPFDILLTCVVNLSPCRYLEVANFIIILYDLANLRLIYEKTVLHYGPLLLLELRWIFSLLLSCLLARLAIDEYFDGEATIFTHSFINRLLVKLIKNYSDNDRVALWEHLTELLLQGLD